MSNELLNTFFFTPESIFFTCQTKCCNIETVKLKFHGNKIEMTQFVSLFDFLFTSCKKSINLESISSHFFSMFFQLCMISSALRNWCCWLEWMFSTPQRQCIQITPPIYRKMRCLANVSGRKREIERERETWSENGSALKSIWWMFIRDTMDMDMEKDKVHHFKKFSIWTGGCVIRFSYLFVLFQG